eukprot:8976953-Lingulodinium_polyedra.AAC.1
MGLGADGHFFRSTNIRGLKRRQAWIRRRRDMDADADGRRGAPWVHPARSDRCVRLTNMAILCRTPAHFDAAT